MSWGSLLVALAVTLVVVAYVSRPFKRRRMDWERVVEAWVREARGQQAAPDGVCPACGQRVAPEHRFCPGCGQPLRGGEG
jgi:uncharacterized OB-fold protein